MPAVVKADPLEALGGFLRARSPEQIALRVVLHVRRSLLLKPSPLRPFLAPEHPLRPKFARLTAAEEAKGLLDQANHIGTRNQWLKVLADKGFTLRGHRLVLQRPG